MTVKKWLLVILAVVCVVTGIICAGANGMGLFGKDSGTEHTFRDKETIYFWYTEEGLTDYINSAAVAFGEQENVRVIPVLAEDGEYLESVNSASLQGEQIPDAFLVSNDALEKAYLSGLASEVTDPTEILNRKNFPQSALLAVTYKGKMVAYPYLFETGAFVYNRTFMDEWAKQQMEKKEAQDTREPQEGGEEISVSDAGTETGDGKEMEGSSLTTEEQIASMVEGAIPSTVDEVLGFADSYDAPNSVEAVFRWDVSDIFYNYHFAGSNMVVGGETGDDKSKIDILNDQTVQCLEIYKKLNQFFYIEPDKVDYDSVIQDFIDGKLVFTIATTDIVKKLEEASQNGTFLYEYGVAPLPKPSAELDGKGLSVTTAVVVNGYSKHQDTANRFAAFLTGEYLEELYRRTGRVSASYRANQQNVYLQGFMKAYENSVSLPKMIETSNFWIQLEIMFSKIWNGADVTEQLSLLSDQIFSQIGEAAE